MVRRRVGPRAACGLEASRHRRRRRRRRRPRRRRERWRLAVDPARPRPAATAGARRGDRRRARAGGVGDAARSAAALVGERSHELTEVLRVRQLRRRDHILVEELRDRWPLALREKFARRHFRVEVHRLGAVDGRVKSLRRSWGVAVGGWRDTGRCSECHASLCIAWRISSGCGARAPAAIAAWTSERRIASSPSSCSFRTSRNWPRTSSWRSWSRSLLDIRCTAVWTISMIVCWLPCSARRVATHPPKPHRQESALTLLPRPSSLTPSTSPHSFRTRRSARPSPTSAPPTAPSRRCPSARATRSTRIACSSWSWRAWTREACSGAAWVGGSGLDVDPGCSLR